MTDDLRTALTKLAEHWVDSGSAVADVLAGEIRDLLDAHPAVVVTDTRREDVAAAIDPDAFDLRHGTGAETAGHVVVRRLQAHQAAQRVLAVLPAPPVVNADTIREFIVEEVGFDSGVGMTDQAQRLAARLRGATRD